MSKFYIGDEDESSKGLSTPIYQSRAPSTDDVKTKDVSQIAVGPVKDVLLFPVESSHAYSYAHLSPNSLAMRLSVLRRSLEILRDRPAILESFKAPNHRRNKSEAGFKLKGNASSAALSALFDNNNCKQSYIRSLRPSLIDRRVNSFQLNRSEELQPTKRVVSASETLDNPHNKTLPVADLLASKNSKLASFTTDRKDFEDIIEILENDPNLLATNSETAQNLESLNESTMAKLLYALSMPFLESTMTSSLLVGEGSESTDILKEPTTPLTPTSASRPFQNLSSGKNALPQAVFTVESVMPWSVKAANDLAYLMFGISKTTVKRMTLMDLVAPSFRSFVSERMMNDDQSIKFAGEIVAVAPQGGNLAWTSVWAKKRGNLIIVMFDRIPCDAFDVDLCLNESQQLLQNSNSNSSSSSGFKSSSNSTNATLASSNFEFQTKDTHQISNSNELPMERSSIYNDEIKINEISGHFISSRSIKPTMSSISQSIDAILTGDPEADSFEINCTRYFTLNDHSDFIPCAVTSTVPQDNQLKIKIHSLPYIAGIFVISADEHNIVSCNNAIAKNLFGRSSSELLNSPIELILPKFSEILKRGFNTKVSKGLVLPEHFFRKYDALIRSEETGDEDSESMFANSRGIQGIHKNGSPLWVDVQLRAASVDTYVLWITYSRQTRREEISARSSQLSLHDEKQLPNQLALFEEHKHKLEESSISRNNSVKDSTSRDPTKNTTTTTANSSPSTTTNKNVPPKLKITTHGGDESVKTKEQEETYNAEYLLQKENEMLKQKALESPNWPTSVGSNRRKKKFSEFKILKNMGEGAYGKVVLTQHVNDAPYKVIIKCIDKEKILVDTWVRDRKLGTIPSEINVMAFLNNSPHPNIMRILDFFEDSQYYYLETPIFGNPPAIDLFDYIEIKKNITESECQHIFRQIVEAVNHLHNHGIVHRDIKDENVIVDEHGIIKLIDFGSAGYTKSGPFDVFVGTIDFASPEVLRGEKYDGRPQDIWALGILLYTMLYKENPFYNVDQIMDSDLKIPFLVSEESESLIRRMLIREADERPTIGEVLEDVWVNT